MTLQFSQVRSGLSLSVIVISLNVKGICSVRSVRQCVFRKKHISDTLGSLEGLEGGLAMTSNQSIGKPDIGVVSLGK